MSTDSYEGLNLREGIKEGRREGVANLGHSSRSERGQKRGEGGTGWATTLFLPISGLDVIFMAKTDLLGRRHHNGCQPRADLPLVPLLTVPAYRFHNCENTQFA